MILSGEVFFLRGEEMGGDFAKVPYEAACGEGFERVIGDVNFPPEETLADASHVVMMIVVPALAEGHEGEEPIVAAGVGSVVEARTEKMRERIDGEGVVPEKRGAQAESPEKERQAAHEKKRNGERGRRNYVIFVEPAELGKSGEVADVVEARVFVFIGDDPADVRPEKTEKRGRVKILFLIRVAMMMAVMSGPPENALLRGGHGHEGDNELKDAARFERAMGKVAVIAGGDEKHAHDEKRDADDEIRPMKWKKENSEGKNVNDRERKREKNRNAGAVGQGNRPIARESCHPACSSVDSGVVSDAARKSAGSKDA